MTEWQRFRQMTGKQKCVHLWTYYKFHFLAALAAFSILGSFGSRLLTGKQPALYLGEINVQPDEALQEVLTHDCFEALGTDPGKQEIVTYSGLSLFRAPTPEQTDLANASLMKLMTAVNSGMLDVVLMNREAYDLCSADGYLMDLTGILDPSLAPLLTENEVVTTDENGENPVTQQVFNGLNAASFPVFENLPEEIYLGIIFNSSRVDIAANYIACLSAWTAKK